MDLNKSLGQKYGTNWDKKYCAKFDCIVVKQLKY